MTLGATNISFTDIVTEQRGVTSDSHTLEQLSNIAGFWSPASSNTVPPFKLSYFKGYQHITGNLGAPDSSSTSLVEDTAIPLFGEQAGTIQVVGEFTRLTDGILYESGATGQGLILYVYNSVIYGQAGDGSGTFGQDSTFECSYEIPTGVTVYEITFTASFINGQSNLYVNGYNNPDPTTSTDVGAMSNVSSTTLNTLSGTNSAGWGRSYTGLCMNRAGWASADNQGGLTNATFTKSYVWNSYMAAL